MTKTLQRYLPLVPWQPLRDLFNGRQACAKFAAECVARRLRDLEEAKTKGGSLEGQRKDILTSLILARDPETGALLSLAELETEAFGFMCAEFRMLLPPPRLR
jgi:cytochrome P450